MSQGIWDVINPNTTSGTQLATLLNDFKDAVVSGFIGNARPSNLQAGGYWVDNTDDATGYWSFKLYTGSSDIEMWKINKVTGEMTMTSAEGEFSIVKTSDDINGPLLKMQKKRTTGGGKVLAGDVLSEVQMLSTDDGGISYVSAKIVTVSENDVSSSQHGAYVKFLIVPKDGSGLAEVLRVSGDGSFGFGVANAEAKIHIASTNSAKKVLKTELASDDAIACSTVIRKKRVANNGKVLSGDGIGEHIFSGTDENGNEVELAKIEVKATQDITTANNGSEMIFSVKDTDTNNFKEAIKVKDGVVYHYGIANTNTQLNKVLEDDSATRNLFSIDGSKYGSLSLEVLITGRDNSETRQQRLKIDAVYDYNNSTWGYEEVSDIITGSERVVDLDYTNGQNLVIDYVNKFTAADFQDGTIYIQVRRNLR